MRIQVITLFPQMIETLTEFGITGRAAKQGLLEVSCITPRDFCDDPHRTVDDRPFGGGPGMVMKFAPCVAAIRAARAASEGAISVLMTPQGRRLEQSGVQRLAQSPGLILVAGRYEGLDERIVEAEIDEELSLGDFVLSGGELAAMAVIDSVARLQPGALGHADSATQDSFSDGLLEHPHYTRPTAAEGRQVPDVLRGGDHAAIARWRRQQALGRTWLRRPDLLAAASLTETDQQLLEAFKVAHKRDQTD